MQAPAAQVGNNRVDEGLGLLAGGCVRPRGTAALTRVPVQGELRDHEDRGTRVERGTLVVKDAQLSDLAGDRGHLLGPVAALDAQEDNEAMALPRLGGHIKSETSDDAAVDADLARGGALDDGAHQRDPRAEPRPPKPVEPPRWPASRERSAPGRVSGDTEDLP